MSNNTFDKILIQHKDLVVRGVDILAFVKNKNVDAEKLILMMTQFKVNLIKHIDFENENLYQPLLRTLTEKRKDSKQMEVFISEMDEILAIVLSFFSEVEAERNIEEKIKIVKEGFREIFDNLKLRIEAEEEGVIGYTRALLISNK